ncbi:MAG: acetyl-CoA carboxylase carboxyl transferase subunit beta [Actinobacteria bacterium]|nr:acetyl-CoA carboxylase carboxyl transferase subunit beta [Actinomycetota bacterium]
MNDRIKTNLKEDILWLKCSNCKEFIFKRIFEENLKVCPICGFHYRIGAYERIEMTFDDGIRGFKSLFEDIVSKDILGFTTSEPYSLTLEKNREKSGVKEAVIVGTGKVKGYEIAAIIFDFNFMGGSMGFGVGERIIRIFNYASQKKLPVFAFIASGGARMQEGMVSLYQMPRTIIAVEKFKEETRLPYVSIFLNPTTGGVLASFAYLADYIAAEPNALIGFAGPRVIEKTIGRKLPERFQRSEFLLEKGLIDKIVRRNEIRDFVSWWCRS